MPWEQSEKYQRYPHTTKFRLSTSITCITLPDPAGWRAARNRILQQITAHGRWARRVHSGSTRRSVAENTIFRFKTLFGGRLWARRHATQRTEVLVKCAVLNRMTQLGMPETVRV